MAHVGVFEQVGSQSEGARESVSPGLGSVGLMPLFKVNVISRPNNKSSAEVITDGTMQGWQSRLFKDEQDRRCGSDIAHDPTRASLSPPPSP